jgi:hypothetical protein
MRISSLNGARYLHRIWQVLDTPKARRGLIPATHVLDAFQQKVPKRELKERSCDAPAAFKVKTSPAECGRRWHERYTSHANPAGCMQPVSSSIYVEELPQKKQSWWISTTAYGDFQPKKILIQNSSRPLQRIGSQAEK